MSIKTVIYCAPKSFSCGCLPADIVICVKKELVAPQLLCGQGLSEAPYEFSYIEASLVGISGPTGCDGKYKYQINYDDIQIVTGVLELTSADIEGMFCKGCVTTYIDDKVGNEVFLTENEEGNTVLVTQHGCVYILPSGAGEITGGPSIEVTPVEGGVQLDAILAPEQGGIPNALTIISDPNGGLYVPEVTVPFQSFFVSGNAGTEEINGGETLSIDGVGILNTTIIAPEEMFISITPGLPAQVVSTDVGGNVVWEFINYPFSNFNLAADSGTAETVNDGEVVSILGSAILTTTVTAPNTITISHVPGVSGQVITADGTGAPVWATPGGGGGAQTPITPVPTDSVDLTVSGLDNHTIEADVNISSNVADAGSVLVPIDIQSTGVVGLRAQIPEADILALLSGDGLIDYDPLTGVIGNISPIPVSEGGTGLAALGGPNSILGVNAAGTDNEYKAVVTGIAGTDVNIANSAGFLIINVPIASATNQGKVSTVAQTFAGAKTFAAALTAAASLSVGTTLSVTGTAAIGSNLTVNGSVTREAGTSNTQYPVPAVIAKGLRVVNNVVGVVSSINTSITANSLNVDRDQIRIRMLAIVLPNTGAINGGQLRVNLGGNTTALNINSFTPGGAAEYTVDIIRTSATTADIFTSIMIDGASSDINATGWTVNWGINNAFSVTVYAGDVGSLNTITLLSAVAELLQ